MVVSSIDLSDNLPKLSPQAFLESSIKDTTINLTNDYRYLKTGYYVSLHAEVLGSNVIPSCENIIDSSRTPILLLRASRAKIPTIPFLVTDNVKKIIDEVGLPVVVFAVNPFIYQGYQIAKNKSALYRAMKSLGMNYKFTVCAQPLKASCILLSLCLANVTWQMSKSASSHKRFMNYSEFHSVHYTFKKQRIKRSCVALNP